MGKLMVHASSPLSREGQFRQEDLPVHSCVYSSLQMADDGQQGSFP